MHNTTTSAGRTRRGEGFATGGAVRQDGTLPIYICNACNQEVVWATSKRTGGKYLANISRGFLDQRFYAKTNIHRCEVEFGSTATGPIRWDEDANYEGYGDGRSAEHRATGD